jgi:anti-anti-sigma regulatory factor
MPHFAQKENPMNSPQPVHNFVIDTTELVRGQEQTILDQLKPLVCEESVMVDLRKVTRIDAAGLAALITLYCDACKAGYRFCVTNPTHHVAELLKLVRLDRLLVAKHQDEEVVSPELQLQESAA